MESKVFEGLDATPQIEKIDSEGVSCEIFCLRAQSAKHVVIIPFGIKTGPEQLVRLQDDINHMLANGVSVIALPLPDPGHSTVFSNGKTMAAVYIQLAMDFYLDPDSIAYTFEPNIPIHVMPHSTGSLLLLFAQAFAEENAPIFDRVRHIFDQAPFIDIAPVSRAKGYGWGFFPSFYSVFTAFVPSAPVGRTWVEYGYSFFGGISTSQEVGDCNALNHGQARMLQQMGQLFLSITQPRRRPFDFYAAQLGISPPNGLSAQTALANLQRIRRTMMHGTGDHASCSRTARKISATIGAKDRFYPLTNVGHHPLLEVPEASFGMLYTAMDLPHPEREIFAMPEQATNRSWGECAQAWTEWAGLAPQTAQPQLLDQDAPEPTTALVPKV